MLAVDLMGAIAWLDPVAERFGRLRRGTIVGIGSVAGDRGRSANPVYNTSKAGLHTFLEAIRNRIGRYGVRVVTGQARVRRNSDDCRHGKHTLEDLGRSRRRDHRAPGAAGRETVYVPARWRYVMWVIRAMPSCVFKRLRV